MRPIEYAPKLSILGTTDKRLKIILGGRGSTKSTFTADWVLSRISIGELWCCAREYQNTIEESVHRLLQEEVERLELPGFSDDKTHIFHKSGGRVFYRGLSRNPTGIKSMLTGVHGIWIEEGEALTWETLRHLSASLRRSAKDIERIIDGDEIKQPEIWITMNRGNSKDPVAQTWLKRAEKQLAKTGIYEDDFMLIVQINYDEIPKSWFAASGLEQERADDKTNMSRAAYNHKWHGDYNDTVENAIIMPEWFDACVDAHIKLGFEPRGVEVVVHDPSDNGDDNKGLAYRHGSVILDVQEQEFGDINQGADWGLGYAVRKKPDIFTWDGDGMGAGIRRQVNQELGGKRIRILEFRGSAGVDNPNDSYVQADGLKSEDDKPKTNKETFKNKRAQYYWNLRDRCYNTYQAVIHHKFIDPDEMISFSSDIKDIELLRAEICRIPLKPNNNGLIQIMNKKDMKALQIDSPNMADSIMMSLAITEDKPVDMAYNHNKQHGRHGWMA